MESIDEIKPPEHLSIWFAKTPEEEVCTPTSTTHGNYTIQEKSTPLSPSKATFRKFLAENTANRQLIEERTKKYESAQQAIDYYKRISWQRHRDFSGLIFLAS